MKKGQLCGISSWIIICSVLSTTVGCATSANLRDPNEVQPGVCGETGKCAEPVVPSIPQQENKGVVNPRTGEYLQPSGKGLYNPRTGDYYIPSGSGYYNPKTGEFVPKRP